MAAARVWRPDPQTIPTCGWRNFSGRTDLSVANVSSKGRESGACSVSRSGMAFWCFNLIVVGSSVLKSKVLSEVAEMPV